ncbi:hypothetical protein [Hoylesella nanceiensis]|jgi:hypothetical protein|uniref:hypothetical protein n=1 Tax=Hoylesella nanceiensis TaxID=425941 RepID=UPI00036644F8|nr:hypothetical protein [Hoylesella nanceiensis]MBF1428448.1 hypothetical protein [Hoylesella nanceiensis]MBF1438614.1 hypothetical protein [Hoylesella nanceiensis]MBF1440380.1 hypothetical protein [Hoylesella nanceiensis]MBF1441317.1 hypothetical protein [Hoylesella nanceiensis]
MIKQLYIICLVLVLMAFSSCEKEETNYYTTAITRLELSEGEELMQIQGTITLLNITNQQAYSTSTFSNSQTTMQVLRGVYSLQGEGTVRVKMADGSVSVRYFRVSESYVEVLNNSTTIVLHPIWL